MASATKPHSRPLSPHLQVYRLPLTAILSITHRITGIGLSLGLLLLTWWLVAGAYGQGPYETFQTVLTSWFGQLVLFGFSVALYFHLCNGIRHLFWDAGKGFEIGATQRANLIVLAAATVLTVLTWLLAI
ncbi:MAG: succinate dehydrogenase, cytochrome b556 subunit [Rhodospirillaceae bacterium]|nr:succinate dehydrogenase, cytochrome b556 subunit [Rhodospirillaceae bacterium]